jgi:hypothetical protein
MRFLCASTILAAINLIGSTIAAPVVRVHPGGAEDIVITNKDTVNATNPAPANSTSKISAFRVSEEVASTNGRLPLSLVNNYAGSINAYVTGLDSNNELVMLQPDGTWFYPTCDPTISTYVESSSNRKTDTRS